MSDALLKQMEEKGYTHYKGRAECFADVINGFHIIQEHNLRSSLGYNYKDNVIRLISPTIKGSLTMDAVFDFWTTTPIKTIQTLWDTKAKDLHRMIQTIKPFDKYDGKIDLSFWGVKSEFDDGYKQRVEEARRRGEDAE